MVTPPLFKDVYRGKRVLLTGDTGFKGAWLAEWLVTLGAQVIGFSLPPPTSPALFEQLRLTERLREQVTGDVRDLGALTALMGRVKPDFVFHLAAQPLVRLSYREPVDTFAINVLGTANVLEAVRLAAHDCVVVVVTTDKCYENREWLHGYREEDPLGGHDPYSASKAAAELVVSAYRRSFFSGTTGPRIRVASVRAGNVVGGGDWALDRIVPDCMRSLARAEEIGVRAPRATRPWQHVLEPLSGYLWLGAGMAGAMERHAENRGILEGAFNFGPALASNRTVGELVDEVLRTWPGRWRPTGDADGVHEAGRLNLATDKAFHVLGWAPVWDFGQTVKETVSWYRAALAEPARVPELTSRQIAGYVNDAQAKKIVWTQ